MQKKTCVSITIILSLIELTIIFLVGYRRAISFNSNMLTIISYVFPCGALYFMNYYIITPIIYYLFLLFLQLLGHYNHISKQFNSFAEKCVMWLVNQPSHWGAIDSADERQNANTCEGLLALQKSGLIRRYGSIYKEAFDFILNEATDNGLVSKSLNQETVVCTAMLLYLYSKNRTLNGPTYYLDEKINSIAKHLWAIRSPTGWGIYVSKSTETNCSFASSFWALYALNEYDDIAKTDEYIKFVRHIYEYSNKSTFGFARGDTSRLWPTAMSAILYYNSGIELQKSLSQVYNIKDAVKFVFNKFCKDKVECETEILVGIDRNGTGATKVPWEHISIGVVVEALVLAYNNHDLCLGDMNLLILRLKNLCSTNLALCNGNEMLYYYTPCGMETHNNGTFTFPTFYLVWGLSVFNQLNR